MSSKKNSEPLYLTIDGQTYDATEFVHRHPGGSDLMRLGTSRDVSILFHSYHRRIDYVKKQLEQLPKVSPASSADIVVQEIETPFYSTLKQRVNKYFEDTRQSSRGGLIYKAIFLLTLTFILWKLVMIDQLFILCPLLGCIMAVNGLAIQHDANHGAFSSNPFVNEAFGCVDDLIGGSSLMWRHQHILLHHAHPNDSSKDADTFSQFPILRMNPKLKRHWYHLYQHIYGPMLYSLIGPSYLIGDIVNFIQKQYEYIPLQPLNSLDRSIFIGGKAIHIIAFFLVPCILHGWSGFFYLYLPTTLFGSLFLATLFAVNHNTEETEYNVDPKMDWAEQQVRTSANWNTTSWFWWHVTGGLNFQIEHHLFPGISHIHYPALSEIVKKTCKEFNIPYFCHPTFTDIFRSHINQLYLLGHKD
jgi:fatty acid desaturase